MSNSGGWRNLLNGSPLVSGGVIVVVVAIAVSIWYASSTPQGHGKMFFSSDDGKTYFAGTARATPYNSGGKVVYQAQIFVCDGKEFVGYLRRYPPGVKEQVDRQLAQETTGLMPSGEVKRPGDADWVPEAPTGPGAAMAGPPGATVGDAIKKANEITIVMCPDGKRALLHLAN